MIRKFGIISEWEKHQVYCLFYKLIKENSIIDQKVEWLENPDGDVVGISIPLNDGTYRTYRRMFKGYDQIEREIWEEMFFQSMMDKK